jgi:outer membrane protein assembly factor BamB
MKPRILWQFRCPGDSRLYASPALAGGELIAVANRTHATGGLVNTLFRLDAATGRLVGGLDLRRAGVSSPAVRGPLILVGEGYHEDNLCNLRIVDRRSGISVNSFPTASHVESSPALDGPRVVFGAGDDGVFGVELTDDGALRQLWHVEGDHVDASPLVADGTAFVGSTGESDRPPVVLAIDAVSGAGRWRTPTPLPVIAAPAFDGGRLFVALSNGKLDRDADRPAGAVWCLDPATGHRLWDRPMTSGMYASPVCQWGCLYVAGGDGACRCLRQSDGSQVWESPLGDRVVAGPIVSGGAMFVLTQSGVLVRLDAATGQVAWRFDQIEEYVAGHDAHASPVLADGCIYVAAGGHVFCIADRRE